MATNLQDYQLSTSSMEPSEGGKTIFLFFRLPKELREQIYKSASVNNNIGKYALGDRICRIIFQGTPITKLLMINKTFSTEYKECLEKAQSTLFRDTMLCRFHQRLAPKCFTF